MEKFLMICYVAADFGPFNGEMFQVTPDKIGAMIMAPAWIKDTLIFKWLLKDGSITMADNKPQQKKLENDPMAGITPEGKAETAEKEADSAPVAVKTISRRSKKGEAK